MNLKTLIAAARGEIRVDLVLKNAKVVDVASHSVFRSDVAIAQGIIVGLGDYDGREEIDLKGRYLAPGFIEGHIHLESSKLVPDEFCRLVIGKGTTTVVCDPHEIANVHGVDGIKYILEAGKYLPINIFVMAPSSVPATGLETSGAEIKADIIKELNKRKRVIGLAEMMDYAGVIAQEREILEKIKIAKAHRVDGHAPGLTGKDLCAYIAAGIYSDHECTTKEEAAEKLRAGMYIMARESSSAKNLEQLLTMVSKENSRRIILVRDDIDPRDLAGEGDLNYLLKRAVQLGIDPVTAVQMATINPADYFKFDKLGLIAPGYQADLVVLSDLIDFQAEMVIKNGQLCAEGGKLNEVKKAKYNKLPFDSINIKMSSLIKLKVVAHGHGLRVIEVIPGQIITRKQILKPKTIDGEVVADIERDILKIAVVERHHASGNIGVGFIRGIGLKSGAIASSIAHDSHNVIVVGTNDSDMAKAVTEIKNMRGGQVVLSSGVVLSSMALPIAGLLSDKSANEVIEEDAGVIKSARDLGSELVNPFFTLSFLALPVIPSLKITDKGLVDVDNNTIVPLMS